MAFQSAGLETAAGVTSDVGALRFDAGQADEGTAFVVLGRVLDS